MKYEDGSIYEGKFKYGMKHGRSILKNADGSVYEGQWKKGKKEGMGKLTNADGVISHEGKWCKDKPYRKGTNQF